MGWEEQLTQAACANPMTSIYTMGLGSAMADSLTVSVKANKKMKKAQAKAQKRVLKSQEADAVAQTLKTRRKIRKEIAHLEVEREDYRAKARTATGNKQQELAKKLYSMADDCLDEIKRLRELMAKF